MNGIIVVNKEKGMTSHDVVNKIRRIFKTKQVGHLGTLDPLAEGVLAVCINDATKLVQFLSEHDKTYIATICLGKCTDTYDLEGTVIEQKKVYDINESDIDKVLNSFLGESEQIPPIYSSIKVNGKKLYEYARNNESVVVEPRKIKIYDIKRISDLTYNDDCCFFDIEVSVSKGTYIRSLCYDIGKKLEIPSLMYKLIRTKLGNFGLKNSNTLSEIEIGNYHLYSKLDALECYTMIEDKELIVKASSGMKISIRYVDELINDTPEKIVIKDNDRLIAIYEKNNELKCYKAARVWM